MSRSEPVQRTIASHRLKALAEKMALENLPRLIVEDRRAGS